MTRSDALPYVSFIVDDALNGREYTDQPLFGAHHRSVLVGWQCGFEPLFVAVHSYLDVQIDDDEAEELARDYLTERGWFGCNGTHCTDDGCTNNARQADYIIR